MISILKETPFSIKYDETAKLVARYIVEEVEEDTLFYD